MQLEPYALTNRHEIGTDGSLNNLYLCIFTGYPSRLNILFTLEEGGG